MDIDLIIVLTFLAATLYVGFMSGGAKTVRGFAVSKRDFSTSFMVATIFATWIGGEDLIGVSELAFMYGGVIVIVVCSQFVGLALHASYIAPKLLKDFRDAMSVGDIMGGLYGNVGRVLSGIAAAMFSFGYVVTQTCSMGYVCHMFIGVDFFTGTLIGATIVTLYSVFGGIRSVVWTDFLQFGVLMVATPVIASVALANVGGIEALFNKIPDLCLSRSLTFDGRQECAMQLVVSIIPIFNPLVIQRILMSRDLVQARQSIMVSGLLYFPFYTMIVIIALCAAILAPDLWAKEAFLYVVDTCLAPGLRGIAVMGVLAVIMSTADSHLNLASIAVVNDVFCGLKKNKWSDKTKLFMMRVVGLLVGLGSLTVSESFARVIDVWLYYINFWAPVVTSPMLLYAFNKPLSKKEFLVSAGFGLVAIGFYRYNIDGPWLEASFIIGLFVSMFVGLVMRHFRVLGAAETVVESGVHPVRLTSGILRKIEGVWRGTRLSWSTLLGRILAFSSDAVRRHGARYTAFGIFSLINYMMPFYMWSERHANNLCVLTIRITAGVLSFLLAVSGAYEGRYRRYLPLFWHFTVMFCLPFLTFYMMLFDGPTLFWVINISLATIMGLILLDMRSFSVIFPLGFFLAFALIKIQGYEIALGQVTFQSAYLFVFSVVIVVIFFRDQENITQIKLDAVRVFGASMSHELRTPLAVIAMHVKKLGDILGTDERIKLTSESEKKLRASVRSIDDQCNQMSDCLSVSLTNLRVGDTTMQVAMRPLEIRCFIEQLVDEYPFASKDMRDSVKLDLKDNFTCMVDPEVLKYVIFNLLQNAVYQITSVGKGEITISSRSDVDSNILSVRDTARGMSAKRVSEIFKPFVSYTPGGTGVGLAFCKKAVNDMGASMQCESIEGEFCEFIISFPVTRMINGICDGD